MLYTRQYLMLEQNRLATGDATVPANKPARRSVKNNRYSSVLPLCLKKAMEAISGIKLPQVRVHYNSSLPAQVNALAYAQGLDIYLAPGQEHHLAHELGHVVQQALGMVQPTTMANGVEINDDPRLEQHASELGEQAVLRGCD